VILLVHGDREFCCEPGDELHTDLGVLDVPEDVENGDVIETHLGEPYTARSLRGPDLFENLERTGAPMMPKDIGLLCSHTGICASDRVLDAGTGTGILASYLGRMGADVLTFEQKEEFAEVARKNMQHAEAAENVTVRAGDICESLEDLGRFDVLTLDTADAPAVVEHAPELLVSGGYVGVYSPFVESARAVNHTARDVGLSAVETLETIQRELEFDDRGSRPSTAGVGHTGYLTIARNL